MKTRVSKKAMTEIEFGKTQQQHKGWFKAARDGDDELVAKYLKHHPALVDITDASAMTALHRAAEYGRDKVVARLLAACPSLIHARNCRDWLALQHAFDTGIITTQDPRVPDQAFWCDGRTALHFAASNGHEKVFARLVAASPEAIDAVNVRGTTVLHFAARNGHETLVEKILALRPEMISVVNGNGTTAFEYAVEGGHGKVADKMLTLKPELVYRVAKSSGNTILHAAIWGNCSKQFVAKVLRMNPQALFMKNNQSCTPFHAAVLKKSRALIELFQLSLSFDDNMTIIVNQFEFEGRSLQEKNGRPLLFELMERQCERALQKRLPRELTDVVCEYIGVIKKKKNKNKEGNKKKKKKKIAQNKH